MKFAVSLLLLIVLSEALATASNSVLSFFPRRPSPASQISATVGIFERYQLTSSSQTVYGTITIYDDILRREAQFYVAYPFLIDGAPVRCKNVPPLVAAINVHLCETLPGLVPGKTKVVVLDWPVKGAALWKPGLATDSIKTVP